MAIPRSKLSDLLGLCTSAEEMLSRLRGEELLSAAASEDDILRVIQEGLKETADEIAEQGFTWATADTRIAAKLALGGYLSEKGSGRLPFAMQGVSGGSLLRRLLRHLARE